MSDMPADFGAQIPPPPRPIEYQDVDTRGWWFSMLVGALLVVVGVWLLSNLYESVTVLAVLVGLSLIVAGAVEIMMQGGPDEYGWAAWVGGGVVIVAGLVLLAWPSATLTVVAVAAGLGLIGAGLIRIAMALQRHNTSPDWTVALALGVVGVVLGGIILAWPSATLMVLGFLLGVKAVITGLIAIGTGWKLRQLAR